MLKILITGGGSEEPIDNVRSVTNFSTGRTAAFLADALQKNNSITLITNTRSAKPTDERVTVKQYKTFAELKELLQTECSTKQYDAVIHAAAVSDFSPDTIIVDGKEFKPGAFSKIPSGTDLIIHMKKNPKLVDSIKTYAGTDCVLVAFKLTSNATQPQREEAVQKVFNSTGKAELSPDFVTSNDLSEITANAHPCRIYARNMSIAAEVQNLEELAATLEQKIAEKTALKGKA